MEDLIHKIESFENEFDLYNRITEELENFRVDLSRSWNDNASREINSKFLNPFSDNCENISINYNNLIQKLKSLNDIKNEIENICKEVKNLSNDISLHLNQCLLLRERSNTLLQDAYLKEADTNTLFRKTEDQFKEIEKLKKRHLEILESA